MATKNNHLIKLREMKELMDLINPPPVYIEKRPEFRKKKPEDEEPRSSRAMLWRTKKIIDYTNPLEDIVMRKPQPKPEPSKAAKPPRSSKSKKTKKVEDRPVEESPVERRVSIIECMPTITWNFDQEKPKDKVETPKWMEPFDTTGLFEARYDILPMELIIIIFKQITNRDRLAAGETCRRWNEASHYYEPFLNQTYYHFDRVEFGDHVAPFKYFSKGFRYYPRLVFTQVEFNKHSDFWELHGLWITELTLRCCIIRKKKFLSIMRNLLNLRRLELMQCDELFKNWTIEYNTSEPMFPFFLFCLKHLSLSGCDYFNEFHFERFITMAPNLQSIDVSNCFINLYLSKRITMLDRVMKLISRNRHHMKCLNLTDTPCVDDFTWHCLCDIEELRLTHFTMAYSERVPLKDPGIIRFFTIQSGLTHLDLTSSIGLNDDCMQIIITTCLLLHTLKIRRCWLLSDDGVVDMHTLQHLRVLDISSCERISDFGINTFIVGKRHREMHELYLSLLNNLSESTLYYIMVTFRNVQILDLDSTSNCVSDETIQYIICYLWNLQHLNVIACTKLTDAGFTGIDLPHKTFAIWDIEETFSIERLKKLKVLKVSGCYKLTDFSLRYAFRFMELKELSLSRCHQLSKQGIEKLVENCPALEYLDLSECPNINDQCVELIAQHLKRLSTLKLANCPLISEVGLSYLSQYCKNLKYLYVRGCFKLPPDISERLANITTLRQVYKS